LASSVSPMLFSEEEKKIEGNEKSARK